MANNPNAGREFREAVTRQELPDGSTVKPEVSHDPAPISPGSTRRRRVDLKSVAFCAKRTPEKFRGVLESATAKLAVLGVKGGKVTKPPEAASGNVNVRGLVDFVASVVAVDKNADDAEQAAQREQLQLLAALRATLATILS